jgi:hypothetical protein
MVYRYCTAVAMTRKGWIPSMRVWKLEAFDGDRRVAMIEENCGSNDVKFRRFCQLIAQRGYQLSDAQVRELCATLALHVPTERVDMCDDPFSQAAVFRPEWEEELRAAQHRPADFQTWLTLAAGTFGLISVSVALAELGALPDDCTCRETAKGSALTYLLDCRRGWLGVFLCAPFSLALKGVIFWIPAGAYKRLHAPLVTFWVVVVYALRLGGEVLRDSARRTGQTDFTTEDLAMYPKLQNCLSVAHIVHSYDPEVGPSCRDLDPDKTMQMRWPWPGTHGCESMVFSTHNISALCEFQVVLVFLHSGVRAALVQNLVCAALFVAAATRGPGGFHLVRDVRALFHAVVMQLVVGTGISVCLFVENEKRRKQFAMAKVARLVTRQSRALLGTLIPKNVLTRLASYRRFSRHHNP